MVRPMTRVAGALVVTSLAAAWLATAVYADEIWVAPTYQQDFGGLGVGSSVVWPATAAGAVRLAWAVPGTLQTFQSAKLVLVPHNPGGSATLTLFVCTAQDAELVFSACGGPFNHPFTGVPNQLLEVDVSAALAPRIGTPGAHYLAVLAFTAPTAATDHIVGLRFTYDASVNWFDVSGIPIGFADGVDDVGAVTGGSNTFSGTQTVDAGNVDLDASTAASGNLTKDGVRFLHNFGGANTFLGAGAGNFTMTGTGNTAEGFNALSGNSTGSNNVAIGVNAGSNATTGSNNIYLGADVAGVAGESDTIYIGNGNHTRTIVAGIRNVSFTVGCCLPVQIEDGGRLRAGRIESGGIATGAVGPSHLQGNAVTAAHLAPDSVGTSEVAFNYAASASEGGPASDLACVGCVSPSELAFTAATLGANNFSGLQRINNGNFDIDNATPTTGIITKNNNRFLHDFGQFNTFLGEFAGNLTMSGISNTVVGDGAFNDNTTGNNNTVMGDRALTSNTTGSDNIAIGMLALHDSIDGSRNTGLGRSVLRGNDSGSDNTAVGFEALRSTSASNGNAAVGSQALLFTRGDRNTGVGATALDSNTTGTNNAALGYGAGANATTGSNNIYLGANVPGVAGESNAIYLGRFGVHSKTVIAGIFGIQTPGPGLPVLIDPSGQLGTSSSSRRYKEGIRDLGDTSRRLFDLRPVAFRYTQAYGDGSKPIQFGLIAEEVAEVFPELAFVNAQGQPESVHYEKLAVLLLNEVQRQQKRIEALERRIEALAGARPGTDR
jgi:hypothetical protein